MTKQKTFKTKRCNTCGKQFKTSDARKTRCKPCREHAFTDSGYWKWVTNTAPRTPYKACFQQVDHIKLVALYDEAKRLRSYASEQHEDEHGFNNGYKLVALLPLDIDHRYPAKPKTGSKVGAFCHENFMIVPQSLNRSKKDKVINKWGVAVEPDVQWQSNKVLKYLLRHPTIDSVKGKYNKASAQLDREFEPEVIKTVADVLKSENERLQLGLSPDSYTDDAAAMWTFEQLLIDAKPVKQQLTLTLASVETKQAIVDSDGNEIPIYDIDREQTALQVDTEHVTVLVNVLLKVGHVYEDEVIQISSIAEEIATKMLESKPLKHWMADDEPTFTKGTVEYRNLSNPVIQEANRVYMHDKAFQWRTSTPDWHMSQLRK